MSNRRKVLDLFEAQKDVWEEQATRGIEAYRKGDAKLTVTDRKGNPLSDVKVTVKQKSHEFRFGINLLLVDEMDTPEKAERYESLIRDSFNMGTVPFYWKTLEPERGKSRYEKGSPYCYRRPAIDTCVDLCNRLGIEPREHALAYEHFFPDWLYDKDVDEIKKEMERHYAEISERYANKMRTIEVTNEMYRKIGKTKFFDAFDYVEWCFKTAEKYFPNNQLVVNETTPLCWDDTCRVTDKYYAYIEANLLKGVKIDAIGMQYHMFYKSEQEYEETRPYYNPKNLYAHMDLYSNLNKPLQITEVTVPAYSNDPEDEELQAEILEKLYRIWFSHPNVEQIVYWNLIDGYAYVSDPDPAKIAATKGDMSVGENYYYGGLVRYDMTPKPAFYKLRELIQKTWHTEETLSTDAEGRTEFRGFYGDYEVNLRRNGKSITRTITLSSKEKNNFCFVLSR
ncbi:MAG: endo-1,4-beta-xylanase [Clostridia bacterium]|nr:endo-1,4-beta-xylanase [Clostridia bacterium]